MYELPTSITISGVKHPIRNKGDFRVILDCFNALQDVKLDKEYRTLSSLIIFYEELTSIESVFEVFPDETLFEAVEEMNRFFNCGQDESPGMKVPYKLVDWDKDEHLIMSAINNVAKKEVRLEPYVHWWTFTGYYLAVGESAFASVVSIRAKIVKHEKMEKYEKKFVAENPEYFNWQSKTTEQEEEEKEILGLWNA